MPVFVTALACLLLLLAGGAAQANNPLMQRPGMPAAMPVLAPQMGPVMEPQQICRAAIAAAERETNLPPRLLFAIARVESGRRDPATGGTHPWPWTINAEGRGSFFLTKEAAIAAVRELQAQGVRSIDVGCMQINLRHHPNAFPSLEAAFDPLTNARYGARFLQELNTTRNDWMLAAGAYHSQTEEHASRYRAMVASAWEAERREPGTAPMAVAGLFGRPTSAAALAAPGGGGLSLSNRAEQARIIPLGGVGAPALPTGGLNGGGGMPPGTGRGLDAYRAAPISMINRPAPVPVSVTAARGSAPPTPTGPLVATTASRPGVAGLFGR